MKTNASWSRRDVLLGGIAAAAAPWGRLATAQSRRLPTHIVDSQVHIWKGGKPSPSHRQEPFTAESLLQEMATGGVERVVIVTPSWNPDGNEYPLSAAQTYPDRFAVMGLFDIKQPPDPARLDGWKKRQGMLGIRLFLGNPIGRAWMTDGSADWFWESAERVDIPVMIFAAGLLPDLAKVATRHPRLRLCIDSFGVPGAVIGLDAFADYDSVLALAKYPNITIKAESVPYISGEPYPYRNLQPILRRTYDAFGPERMFWGSDLTLMKTPYKDCVTFIEELPWLSDRDRELFMGRALSNWIGWPLPA